jgi:hypothetical protein
MLVLTRKTGQVILQASEQFVVPVGPFLYPYGP